MNTNRSNNRRRGRGNNRSPGGGAQVNRIDSRARGNAPQMLEKFRKLAHDASLNDDRVQTEYYLQFADHYFRVLADSRAPKDDQRPRNGSDRDDMDDDGQDDNLGYYDRGQDRVQDNRLNAGSNASSSASASSGPSANSSASTNAGGGRDDRDKDRNGDRDRNSDRNPDRDRSQQQTRSRPEDDGDWSEEGARVSESDGGEAENPFLRDTRSKPARGRPRKQPREAANGGERQDDGNSERNSARATERVPEREGTVDPMSLPPAISRGVEGEAAAPPTKVSDGGSGEDRPAAARGGMKPRTRAARPRAPRPADDGDSGTLEAVS